MCRGEGCLELPKDYFHDDIVKFIEELPFSYHSILINERNVYLNEVLFIDEVSLVKACEIANKRRKILNIVEPNRDLTYMCLKLHFTPYIEEGKIVWSYW